MLWVFTLNPCEVTRVETPNKARHAVVARLDLILMVRRRRRISRNFGTSRLFVFRPSCRFGSSEAGLPRSSSEPQVPARATLGHGSRCPLSTQVEFRSANESATRSRTMKPTRQLRGSASFRPVFPKTSSTRSSVRLICLTPSTSRVSKR